MHEEINAMESVSKLIVSRPSNCMDKMPIIIRLIVIEKPINILQKALLLSADFVSVSILLSIDFMILFLFCF